MSTLTKKIPFVESEWDVKDWLHPIQNALVNTNGVFFISGLSPEGYFFAEDSVTSMLKFCKLSRRICKAYMLATQHEPYDLHHGLDYKQGGCGFKPWASIPQVLIRDKGAFTVVFAKKVDLNGFELMLNGALFDVGDNANKANEEFLCFVLPGFSLQAFDNCFRAVQYRVNKLNEIGKPDAGNVKPVICFECNLKPTFRLPSELTVEDVLLITFRPSISVKRAETYIVASVKSVCGSNVGLFHASSSTTATDLKISFVEHTGWSIQPKELLLICKNKPGFYFEDNTLGDVVELCGGCTSLEFVAYVSTKRLG